EAEIPELITARTLKITDLEVTTHFSLSKALEAVYFEILKCHACHLTLSVMELRHSCNNKVWHNRVWHNKGGAGGQEQGRGLAKPPRSKEPTGLKASPVPWAKQRGKGR